MHRAVFVGICKLMFIVLLVIHCPLPTTTVIAMSVSDVDRRECLWGNLLLRGLMRKHPINIENSGYSMLIGWYFFVLRCWRFPRRGFAPPRNDNLSVRCNCAIN